MALWQTLTLEFLPPERILHLLCTPTHPLAHFLQDPALLPPQPMRSLPAPQLAQLRHVPLLEPPQPVTYLFVPHEQEEHELCPLFDW